ncbi:MAG: hypothetical protein IPM54_26845 [Polyangiaceae bacterium]|nr:hypothetical protein [Polyangiaceae bacterium]
MKVGDQRVRHRVAVLNLAAVLVLVVAAPTVGDIGSCGAEPSDLDAVTFFKKKAELDCARCRECGFVTAACTRACDPTQAPTAFPEGCFPIQHDGDVCLRALEATACDGYATFVADQGATTPTECNFCPVGGAP